MASAYYFKDDYINFNNWHSDESPDILLFSFLLEFKFWICIQKYKIIRPHFSRDCFKLSKMISLRAEKSSRQKF
jgi:hypothetical protein